jgi:hypothetical protein
VWGGGGLEFWGCVPFFHENELMLCMCISHAFLEIEMSEHMSF